jgi:hypothetical protein
MQLSKKELYLNEFSKTILPEDHYYLSFYNDISLLEEFEILFNKATENYGNKHFGIYRMCDAEYIYCVGRRLPYHLSLFGKIKYLTKSMLVKLELLNQKTGHANLVNKEVWFGETYSITEQKKQQSKYLADLHQIAGEGFLAPHLIYSPGRFAEQYIDLMLEYYKKSSVKFDKDNYFMFYFVYMMMSLERYKKILYKDRNVLIITAFNERNKQENFQENLAKEGVKNLYFYNISHDKAMLEVIDKTKLPEEVDLVIIGAGIGSVNIINQLGHLKALCIDAGHALDCLSRPKLRKERKFLIPDAEFATF